MKRKLSVIGGDVVGGIIRKIRGVTPSAFFLSLVDDADAATARATLGITGGTVAWRNTVNRTVGTTAGDSINVGTLSGADLPTGIIRVSVVTNQVNYVQCKSYQFCVAYDETSGAYKIAVPDQDTGVSNGNDIRLEVAVDTTSVALRLVRVSGATSADVYVTVEYAGNETPTWTASTSPGTSAVTTYYTGARLTPAWRVSGTRTQPASGDYVNLGTYGNPRGEPLGSFHVVLTLVGASVVVTRTYRITPVWNETSGAWQNVEAEQDAIAGSSDFQLEVNIDGDTVSFRVRSTAGSSGNMDFSILHDGFSAPVFTPSTSTGTSATTAVYAGSKTRLNTTKLPANNKTGAYTVTAADSLIRITSGTFTVTLANTYDGHVLTIKNVGSGTTTIGGTVDATSNPTLTQWQYRVIRCTGSAWEEIGRG